MVVCLQKLGRVVLGPAQVQRGLRAEDYNREVAYIRYRERAGKVFVLRPEAPLDLSRTERDPEKLQRAYDHGRAVAEKRMAALKEFLNTGGNPNER